MKVSIIIPVLNEEQTLSRLLPFLNHFSGNYLHEIIVADGGSSDGTRGVCLHNSVTHFQTLQKGRSVQMNEGAARATGDVLYFLHADSLPPKYFTNDLFEAITNGCEAGCFKMTFDSRHPLLMVSGWFTRFNVSWCRGGDQSLYVTKKVFEEAGRFNEQLIIYEDNEILERIRKFACFCVIKKTLVTSSRRFKENGTFRLYFIFMVIHTRYRLGTSPEKLLAYYKKHVR